MCSLLKSCSWNIRSNLNTGTVKVVFEVKAVELQIPKDADWAARMEVLLDKFFLFKCKHWKNGSDVEVPLEVKMLKGFVVSIEVQALREMNCQLNLIYVDGSPKRN